MTPIRLRPPVHCAACPRGGARRQCRGAGDQYQRGGLLQGDRPINESGLGAAINYAVNVKGAVIIVAAGNTGQDCNQNPPPDPAIPADPRGWKRVQTIVSPAWYSPLVLTVGGIGQNGQPSGFSMSGPWWAPRPGGEHHRAGLRRRTENALQGQDGPIPIAGTSFAAAYVSGRRRCSSNASPT